MVILWQILNCALMVILWLFPFRYTRNLISTTDKFNLILLCWSEGNASSIHDHTDSECIMKALKGNYPGCMYRNPLNTLSIIIDELILGTVKETRYAWPTKKRTKMQETGVTEGREGDVIWINGKWSWITVQLYLKYFQNVLLLKQLYRFVERQVWRWKSQNETFYVSTSYV